MLSVALVGLSGCAEKEKVAEKKTVEVKDKAATTNQQAAAKPENEEKAVSDFILKNTKVVNIMSIGRRINEKHPDLGPFFVVRGMDERGQKSEIWIKDMKIFEMVNAN